jgi:hypothetical protein
MPGCTSAWLFEQVHSHLVLIREDNSKVFSPNQFAAPAATIQMLVNGAICLRLPSHNHWVKAYENNNKLCVIRELILNPSKISNESLSKVNHNFCGALRKFLICIENKMLILKEPIARSDSYTRLRLVPRVLYNTIFVAFHANSYWGSLECISDNALDSFTLLLAVYVHIHQGDVPCLPRLCFVKPHMRQIIGTGLWISY